MTTFELLYAIVDRLTDEDLANLTRRIAWESGRDPDNPQHASLLAVVEWEQQKRRDIAAGRIV